MKKNMKKVMALALAATMTLGMTTVGFAQDVALDPASQDNATITISNAAKGETYSVYKLFDATVTGTTDGSIAYQGDIPEGLDAFFKKDTAGNILLKDEVDNTALFEALKSWASEDGEGTVVISEESDGSALNFKGLDYGYYVVTSTQGGGASITVNSTNPNMTIVDKNSTTVTDLSKTVNDTEVKIGQEVDYTVKFKTANYIGEGEDAEQVKSYTIKDTLPDFLSDVDVTKIYMDNDGDLEKTTDDQTTITVEQFDDKKIVIDWVETKEVDGETVYTSLYKNGAYLVVEYTATVSDKAAIDGDGNTNEVTVTWETVEGNETPEGSELEKSVTIYSYAIGLLKVDQAGKALANATFQFPFYVKATTDTDGAYIYAGTDAGDGLVNTITTPETGEIIVKGVEPGKYSITETEAPAGYNKLTEAVSVTAVKTGKTTTTVTTYLDADGNETSSESAKNTVNYSTDKIAATMEVVVNKTGVELPSTGGMGTTIFYVLGSIMALGAGVLLVTKKRVGEN